MTTAAPAAQEESASEPLNASISVRCTATEKRAVEFLALAMDVTQSDLMRDFTGTMKAIVEESDRRRALLQAAR